MSTETIAAISTGGTNSGINIIRISGDNAEYIIKNIFKTNYTLDHQKIVYGKIVNPETRDMVDEVLVSCFKAPHSFTGEDVYEVNTHGGRRVTLDVLELILKSGARLAEPGEFSKRAFLNGKMDLSKAEAIIDVINAKTKLQKEIAIHQLEGGLEKKIKEIRNEIVELIAQIEVNIDYPEYDYDELDKNVLKSILERLKTDINLIIKTRDEGKYVKEGIDMAIIGGANSGKSSLLNKLAKEERAIVTDIEGTTRDVIEESVIVGDLIINVSDTAGIRDTDDIVENIGIKKSLDIIEKTDLVLYMIDVVKGITDKDVELISDIKCKKIPIIACINKVDISYENIENIKSKIPEGIDIIEISANTGSGIEELKQVILNMFNVNDFDKKQEKLVVNERHKQNLLNAKNNIKKALLCVENDESVDITAIALTEAVEELGNITGEVASVDVVNKIFEKFCLGK